MTTVPTGRKRLKIGELAKLSGKSVRALHLYEELGLLTPAERSKGGFRLYGTETVTSGETPETLPVSTFFSSERNWYFPL